MKTVGIIAEYNPFHTGHKYQLDQIRQMLHADYIVIAMSGDFVQRGTPAPFPKHLRTRMALSCGADLWWSCLFPFPQPVPKALQKELYACSQALA